VLSACYRRYNPRVRTVTKQASGTGRYHLGMPRIVLLMLAVLLSLHPVRTAAQDDVIVFEPTPALNIFRSRHYRIHTTLSRSETQPFGRHMDAVYEQYALRFRALGAPPVDPMPLYLFRTQEQYNRFLQEHDIDATHSGGMFFVTHKLQGLATWAESSNRRTTYEVLQHEGFHQFAWHTVGPRLPVWLNEGLAQYFESAVIRDDQLSLGITCSSRIDGMKDLLHAGKAMSLEELSKITSTQWSKTLNQDSDRAAALYTQAWSVTYFLIHGDDGAHQASLLEYLKSLSKGDKPESAQLMAFGSEGLASLEDSWKEFAATQRPDEVAQATERLEFLGTGLRLIAEQGEKMPADLDQLRSTLQRYGFKLRRKEMGVTRSLSAEHDDLFVYSKGEGEDHDFVLLEPDRTGLPPRITAPGLEPEPMLIWYRDADNKLVQDIVYR